MNRPTVGRILSGRTIHLCGLALALAGPGVPASGQTAPGQTASKIALPDLMAVELPAGITEFAPTDPALRDLLSAATSDRRRITADLRRNLGVGAARVTWSSWDGEPGTGTPAATRSATVFILPNGMTQAGVSGDENATAGNNT